MWDQSQSVLVGWELLWVGPLYFGGEGEGSATEGGTFHSLTVTAAAELSQGRMCNRY